jgi:hypothetical protein
MFMGALARPASSASQLSTSALSSRPVQASQPAHAPPLPINISSSASLASSFSAASVSSAAAPASLFGLFFFGLWGSHWGSLFAPHSPTH